MIWIWLHCRAWHVCHWQAQLESFQCVSQALIKFELRVRTEGRPDEDEPKGDCLIEGSDSFIEHRRLYGDNCALDVKFAVLINAVGPASTSRSSVWVPLPAASSWRYTSRLVASVRRSVSWKMLLQSQVLWWALLLQTCSGDTQLPRCQHRRVIGRQSCSWAKGEEAGVVFMVEVQLRFWLSWYGQRSSRAGRVCSSFSQCN